MDPSFDSEYVRGVTVVLDFFVSSVIMESRGEEYAETWLYS